MKRLKLFYLLTSIRLFGIMLFLSTTSFINLFSQEAEWISTKLNGNISYNYHYAIGETCIIFADTANTIFAYDINMEEWNSYKPLTTAQWRGALADGNVCMIWNDSLVVSYSALTHSFSPLPNTGKLIQAGAIHGCLDNFAYIVGPSTWYVYDAEDGQWRAYSYTPPGSTGETITGGVDGKDDYLILHLSVLNDAPSTIAAYSLVTKSFAEENNDYISNPYKLDHGFVFYKTNSPEPYYCGGYSANTGNIEIKTATKEIGFIMPNYYQEIVSRQIIAGFVMVESYNDDFWKRNLWTFNTITGQFYDYDYLVKKNGNTFSSAYCGGEVMVDWNGNTKKEGVVQCFVFSSETNSYEQFSTSIYYWGSIYTSFSVGGSILDCYDSTKYYMRDVVTKAELTIPVNWTSGFAPGIKSRNIATYWNVFAYRDQYEDSLHVVYYSRETGDFNSFITRGNSYIEDFRGKNLCGMFITDVVELNKVLLYSPKYNVWKEKSLEGATFWGTKGDYFYINYSTDNQIVFFDAYTNQEYLFNSPQSNQDVIYKENVFELYTSDGKYIGYSMKKHDWSEYRAPKSYAKQWSDNIVLNFNIDGIPNETLLYDGLNNVFTPLILTDEHPIYIIRQVGGKTAIVVTQDGYLYAYKPGSVTSVDEINILSNKKQKFSLFQNYPNPFNPSTVIKYSIPSSKTPIRGGAGSGLVTLKIYDILGRVVTTLVNERQKPGNYEVQFDASSLASGIYFYQLRAGTFVKSRKMLLLK